MSKFLRFILLSMSCIVLVACTEKEDNDAVSKNDSTEIVFFTGTIKEISQDRGLVDIEEGSILSSGKEVYVDLSVNPDEQFKVGDKIRVGYDGTVMESYPLQIKTLSVEKIK